MNRNYIANELVTAAKEVTAATPVPIALYESYGGYSMADASQSSGVRVNLSLVAYPGGHTLLFEGESWEHGSSFGRTHTDESSSFKKKEFLRPEDITSAKVLAAHIDKIMERLIQRQTDVRYNPRQWELPGKTIGSNQRGKQLAWVLGRTLRKALNKA